MKSIDILILVIYKIAWRLHQANPRGIFPSSVNETMRFQGLNQGFPHKKTYSPVLWSLQPYWQSFLSSRKLKKQKESQTVFIKLTADIKNTQRHYTKMTNIDLYSRRSSTNYRQIETNNSSRSSYTMSS